MKLSNTVPSRVQRNAATQLMSVMIMRSCEIPVARGEGIFCREEPAEVRIEIGVNRPARVELSSARRYCPDNNFAAAHNGQGLGTRANVKALKASVVGSAWLTSAAALSLSSGSPKSGRAGVVGSIRDGVKKCLTALSRQIVCTCVMIRCNRED